MPILIADEVTIETFANVSSPDEIRTVDGRLLGRFIPVQSGKTLFPELGVTDEEVDAWRTDKNAIWHTPEEVMSRLRELGTCSR